MIVAVAIIIAALHLAPWLAIAGLKHNTMEEAFILAVGGLVGAVMILIMVLAFPPVALVLIFTTMYSWRTLYIISNPE